MESCFSRAACRKMLPSIRQSCSLISHRSLLYLCTEVHAIKIEIPARHSVRTRRFHIHFELTWAIIYYYSLTPLHTNLHRPNEPVIFPTERITFAGKFQSAVNWKINFLFGNKMIQGERNGMKIVDSYCYCFNIPNE